MLQTLGVSEQGLPSSEVRKRLDEHGPNRFGASVLAQLAMIYVPVLRWIAKTEPLTIAEWARIRLFSPTGGTCGRSRQMAARKEETCLN